MEGFELLELLLELLFEVAVPVLEELLADLAIRHRDRPGRSFPLFLILIWGSVSGLVSYLIWPHRMMRARQVVPGISLLLAPILTGRVMAWVGNRLRARNITPTALATFPGGALFAFGMALVRFLMVGLK